MRRAGTQGCQRRVGWDQLCDAVPRGVLQSKASVRMETVRYRTSHSQVTTIQVSFSALAPGSPLTRCAAPVVRPVDQQYRRGRLRVGVNACTSSRLGCCVGNEASGSRNGHHRSNRLVAWLTAPVADSLHSTIARQRA